MTTTIESNGYVKPDELFKPMVRRFEDVTITGLGKFRLRTLTAGEAAQYAAKRISRDGGMSHQGMLTSNARIIVLCCVDHEGNQIFSDDDILRIQQLPAGQVATLAAECLQHCGMADAEEEAKN